MLDLIVIVQDIRVKRELQLLVLDKKVLMFNKLLTTNQIKNNAYKHEEVLNEILLWSARLLLSMQNFRKMVKIKIREQQMCIKN